MTTAERGVVARDLQYLFEHGTFSGQTDGQLLERFLACRDERAFQILLERHGRMVLGTCHAILKDPHEAEDAFQATFLVFVHKAASIRGRDSLGGWLHRVAYNIALQANLDNVKRKAEEQRVSELTSTTTASSPEDPLLRSLVQVEVGRLPEKFRLPLVLCDLEGLSREEAARQLHWTEGMVRGRLAQARERLRARLSRRGIPLSAAALGACLSQEAVAAVPEAWILATARAAHALILGVTTAALVSARTSRLMKATLDWMTTLKIKVAAVVMLALAALGGVAAAALAAGEAPPKAQALPPVPTSQPLAIAKASPKPEQADEVRIQGKVLGPNGLAYKGARLFLIHPSRERTVVQYARVNVNANDPFPFVGLQATSDADGSFRFVVPPSEVDDPNKAEFWKTAQVIALADGLGFALSHVIKKDETLTLRLVRDDVPIKGRVVDLQGNPIAGATARIIAIKANEKEDLTAWYEALHVRKSGFDVESDHLTKWLSIRDFPAPFSQTITGADGRFELKGVGRERLATLVIEGPTIESACVNAMTRPADPIRVPGYRSPGAKANVVYVGAQFDHVAGPSRPLEGTVFDKKTKRPLAGVTIRAGNSLPANPIEFVSTTTDAQGHYRLVGLSEGRERNVYAIPSDDQTYLQSRQVVKVKGDDAGGSGRLDFALTRGVRVTGRVIDKATGAPVYARIEYFVYVDNPHLDDSPGFRGAMDYGVNTDHQGAFSIVALPGPGVVATRAWTTDGYLMGVGAEKVRDEDHNGLLDTHPYSCIPTNYHTIAAIDPPAGSGSISCDLVLDPGRTLTGTVLGPEGKPLTGALVSGLFDMEYWDHEPLKSSTFTMSGLKPGKSRFLQFLHTEKKLAGHLEVRGDETVTPVVRLEPWGVLTGRFVDADGLPRKDAELVFSKAPPGAPRGGYLRGNGAGMSGKIVPDDSGRFRIEGLAPGLSYNLKVEEKDLQRNGWVVRGLTINPGELKDLGDVQAQPEDKKAP